jgi:hypothetical protein
MRTVRKKRERRLHDEAMPRQELVPPDAQHAGIDHRVTEGRHSRLSDCNSYQASQVGTRGSYWRTG